MAPGGRLDRIDLIQDLAAGLSSAGPPRIGLEYEVLGLRIEDGRAVPYSGGERSILNILTLLRLRHGWSPVGPGPLIELERGGSRITLEPGAQIELSERPHESLADVERALRIYLAELRDVGDPLGIAWVPLGVTPVSTPDEIQLLPKPRYEIMTRYLPTRGASALWMMRATAGTQVNIDALNSDDAALLLRMLLRLAPIITACFANSPLAAGRPTGRLSQREHIWTAVDPDRCGSPPRSIGPDARLEDYVDWALDAGMIFAPQGDTVVELTGLTFRDFLAHGAQGRVPTLEDWRVHLSSLFPTVRVKRTVEVRCADGNTPERALALSALLAGLCYGGPAVRFAVLDVLGEATIEQHRAFHVACADRGLDAVDHAGRSALALAREVLVLADGALAGVRPNERVYLAPLADILAAGRPPAADVLAQFEGAWSRSPAKVTEGLALR